MAGITEDLTLNIAPALAAVAELDRALTAVLTSFSSSAPQEINAALARTDAAPVTAAIEGAVQGADTKATIADPDTAAVTTGVEGAVESADTATTIADPDATPVTAGIEGAVAASDTTPPPIESPDASAIPEAIEGAMAEADTTITVEADTTAAEASLAGVSGAATGAADSLAAVGTQAAASAGGLDTAGNAATVTSGALAVMGGNFASVASRLGPYGAAIAGAAAVTGVFVTSALEAQEVTARFTDTFGELAPAVEQIDIGGLSGSIAELSVTMGASDDALRSAVVNFAQLGLASGATRHEVAQTSEQLVALSLGASALKPSLGSADQVIGGLTSSLARGGRTLSEYGITLSAAEIETRALANTGKSAAGELTVYEKATAGAQLATEKFGDTLGATVQKGARESSVQLRALKTAIGETIEGLGAPLIEPVLSLFKSAAPAIGGIIKIIGVALQVLAPIISGVAAAFQVIGPIIGAVATALDFLSPALKVVGVVLLALTGPLGLVAAGFTAVKAVVGLFKKDTEEVNQEVAKTPPVIAGMGDALAGTATKIQGFGAAMVPIPGLVASIAETVEVNVPGIAAAFDKASKEVAVSLMSFQVALSEQLRAEREFFRNLNFIIAAGGQEIATLLASQGPERGAAAAKAIAAATPIEIKALEAQAAELKAFELQAGKEIATALATGIALNVQQAMQGISEAVSGAGGLLGRLFTSGAAEGITSGIPSIQRATAGAGQAANRTFGATIDARSPSRVAMALAQEFGAGVVLGLERSVPVVERAAQALAGALAGASVPVAAVGTSSSSSVTVAPGAVQITFAGGITPSAVPSVEAAVDQAFGRLLQELGRR